MRFTPTRRTARRCARAVSLAIGFGASAVITGAQTVPDGLVLQPIVLEPFIHSPVGFAFFPDGRFLLIEKNGNVRVAPIGGGPSTLIFTVPGVVVNFEGGLLGCAVDPDWPQRPFVYLFSDQSTGTIHVTRYRTEGAIDDPSSVALTLTQPYRVLDDLPDQQGIHQGGTLRFGPDGLLYISLGEDGVPCDAQQLNVMKGKILRIDVSSLPEAGSGPAAKAMITPPNNPYVGLGVDAGLVYAYGFRNPFRFTIDPLSGDLWIGDVGENNWEEINVVPYMSGGGGNFGWPEFEGLARDPIADSTCSTGPFATPAYVYPHPLAQPSSVVAGPIYRSVWGAAASLPPSYDGHAFLHEVYGGWIRRLAPTPNGWEIAAPVVGQPSTENWAEDLGSISDLQTGPDGGLYFMELMQSATLGRGLYRIGTPVPSDAIESIAPSPFGCAPNPVRRGQPLTIRCAPHRDAAARVTLYDAAGRLVRKLVAPAFAPAVIWDGRDSRGAVVAAGIYLYRVEAGAEPRGGGKFVVLR